MTTVLRDPAFAGHAPEFEEVIGALPRLAMVVETDAYEGNVANGMAPDLHGGLLVCEQGTRWQHARISRQDRLGGERETVVDDWRGLPFNSPNDVVAARDGSIWFTDPSYGHHQGLKPEPMVGDFVYRHDPTTGDTRVVADGCYKPNGIVLSPDERVLYITDSGVNQRPGAYHVDRSHDIQAFDVIDGRSLAGERLFAVTTPDSRTDSLNFCVGGPERNVSFITTDSAVWVAELAAKGA